MRRIADGLLDAVAGQDGTDLIALYAVPLPVPVICELLGVPDRARPSVRARGLIALPVTWRR